MVRFYEDVMALKKRKDELESARRTLIGGAVSELDKKGYKLEQLRFPPVREEALRLIDLVPKYGSNHFVKGATVHGDVEDKVEEALAARNSGLRFDKDKRDKYNKQLELMAEVAPTALSRSLRVRPFWRPGIEAIPGWLGTAATYSIGSILNYLFTHRPTDSDNLDLTSVENLPYLVGGLVFGALISKATSNAGVKLAKAEVKTEARNLVEALRDAPQRTERR